jgi:PadR family transcriptional regulator, regulatory protein PadR
MTGKSSDLVQGTLEMLILKTLALEAMHGCGVAIRIEQISNGVFCVNPGSLSPALSRLERAGRIKAEWRATGEQPPRQVLPPHRQRKALKDETREWGRQIAAIARILEA